MQSGLIEARLVNGRIVADRSEKALELLTKGYGTEDEQQGIIVYSHPEALYLVENKKMNIYSTNGSKLSFNELLDVLKRIDYNVWRDYVVYRDLRRRKYVVKDGVSAELRFRVFERGKYGTEPAKYLIAPLMEGKNVQISKLEEWLSACRKMNKELVIAVVDRRNEVIYYRASLVDLRNV